MAAPVTTADSPLAAVPTAAKRGARFPTSMWVAVVFALVAGVLVLRVTRNPVIQAAVAARPLLAGEVLQVADVRYADIGATGTVADSLLRPADITAMVGRQLKEPINEGEMLTKSDLVEQGQVLALRAMSIPIEPTHAAGGTLTRTDTVDVVDSSGLAPVFVVVGARVLEVGAPEGGSRIGGSGSKYSVTIAVDEASALRLAAAITADKVDIVRSTGAAPAVATSPPTTVRR